MKKGGIGGAKTVTGLRFEKKINFLTRISQVPNYSVKNNAIYYKGNLLAYSYPKYDLYNKFLSPKGVNYKDYISKKYLPDEALYVPSQDTMFIIEMKFQNVGGSVDEKLQTCDFKRRIYLKLFSKLKLNVKYIFVLSDYFNKSSFDDAFRYIEEVGCSYYFNELPLSELKFPQPTISNNDDVSSNIETTS